MRSQIMVVYDSVSLLRFFLVEFYNGNNNLKELNHYNTLTLRINTQ